MRIIHLLSGAALALAPIARQTSEIQLGAKTGTVADPFSDIVGLAELKDGRAIVSDRIETGLYSVDFSAGTRKLLGRNGVGPNEYQVPFGPVPWLGDTLLVFDGFNRRYLKVRSDGVFGGTIPFVTRAGGGGWSVPRAADAAGHVYWDTPIIQMQPEIKRLMKARIVRWRPGLDSVESVIEFADHAEFEHRFRYRPMPQTDAWVLGPDGRIGILSAADYTLRWYKDGKLVETGPKIPYDRVRVGVAEREAFRMKKAMEPASGASPSGGPITRPPMVGIEKAREYWGDTLFPEYMPPFETSGAIRAPNGNIWVKRTSAASDKSARVDVLDAHGALRGYIKLAPRSRLLAVGASSVYVIAVDDDGLQTLERYAMPAVLRAT